MNYRVSTVGSLIALLIMAGSVFGATFFQSNRSAHDIAPIRIADIPYSFGDWKGEDTAGLDIRSLEVLRLNQHTKRIYKNSKGETVLLYLGYWEQQSGDHQAAKHSPTLCLPSNGWLVTGMEDRNFTFPSPGAEAPLELTTRALLGEWQHRTMLFHFWFFSGEKTYTRESTALINIIRENFLHGRTDGGIVEVTTPVLGTGVHLERDKAEAVVADFMKDFYPILAQLIHREG